MQNTAKPLCIRRYYTQPSHRALRVHRINCVSHCIFYGMVYNSYSTLSRGIPWNILLVTCIFLCIPRNNGTFHGIALEIVV